MPRSSRTGQRGYIVTLVRDTDGWRQLLKAERAPDGAAKRFRACYRKPAPLPKDRKLVTKVCETRSDANAWLAAQIEAINTKKWRDPAMGKVPVGQLLENMLAHAEALQTYAPATLAYYNSVLGRTDRSKGGKDGHIPEWLATMRVEDVEPEHIRKLITDLVAEGAGARTIQVTRQLLSRCFRQAVRDGRINASPVHPEDGAPKSRSGKIKPPESSTVENIVGKIDPRYKAMVLVAAYGGLRIGECAGLQRRHILTETSIRSGKEVMRLRVEQQVTEVAGKVTVTHPKTEGSVRTVTLPSWLAGEVSAHVEAYLPGEDSEDFLFPAPEGGPLHRTNWTRRTWHPALVKAGAVGTRFHDLRHHAASVLIAADVHPKIIAERLGHSDIMITMNRYGHLTAGVEEKAAEALEGARPKLVAV